MDKRKELKEQYKQIKTEAGVYMIKNLSNGKVFLASSPNTKNLNGVKFSLDMGSHMNKALQKEWKDSGEKNFIIEVVEVLKNKEEGEYDSWEKADELKKMLKKWMNEFKPFDVKGYHDIKEAE